MKILKTVWCILAAYVLWIFIGLCVLEGGDYYGKYLDSLSYDEFKQVPRSTFGNSAKELTFWPWTRHYYIQNTKGVE